MSDTQAPGQNILPLLNSILGLPEKDRLSLFNAWMAIDQLDIPKEDVISSSDLEITRIENELDIWLQRIKKLDPKSQLKKLEEALHQEEVVSIRDLLQKELGRLKNAHPWYAAERAVVRYAYEHPVLITVALAGAGLWIYKAGKSLFNIVF